MLWKITHAISFFCSKILMAFYLPRSSMQRPYHVLLGPTKRSPWLPWYHLLLVCVGFCVATYKSPGILTFPLSGLYSDAIFSVTPFLTMHLKIVVLNPTFFFPQVSSVIALITNLYLPTILFPNSIHWNRM